MIRSAVTVHRPAEVVFDYAAEFDRHPEWQPDLTGATISGPAAVGVTGTETRKMGPRTTTYDWRVSAFDRPRRLGFETLSGPLRPTGTMTFTPEGEGTRVAFEMDLNPRGLLKALAPLIERRVQRDTDGHLLRFKDVVERA